MRWSTSPGRGPNVSRLSTWSARARPAESAGVNGAAETGPRRAAPANANTSIALVNNLPPPAAICRLRVMCPSWRRAAATAVNLPLMATPVFPHGIPRFGRSPQNTDKKASWSERLHATKYVGPFLRMVYQTQPFYTTGIVILRLVGGLVPVAILWIGKLIIDAVVSDVQLAGRGEPVDWRRLITLVVLELVVAVGGGVVARASSLLESLLGDLFSNRMSVKLLQHAATLDLSQFEDPDTYDHLERARRQTVGRIGLLGMLLG